MSKMMMSYDELQLSYKELDEYLKNTMLGPDEEKLLIKHERLGEDIYQYHQGIINHSGRILSKSDDDFIQLVNLSRKAREELSDVIKHVGTLASVTRTIDKVLSQLARFL